tara:strand:- start:100568 stop:101440 length:873 start_codon:yes stop_codon:yes gene_type:complete
VPAISKLILGTVQFGLNYGVNNKLGQMSILEAHEILDLALKSGVKTLDTAAAYGTSEQVIGDFIKLKDQNPFNVITKLALKDGITWESSLKNSQINLGIGQIDTLMFHSYRDYANTKGQLQELLSSQKGKGFNKLGVSVYTNEELVAVATDEHIDLVQAPFNLLDNNSLRGEALRKCKEHNKEVHTRSAYLQGLFFMEDRDLPERLRPLRKELGVIHDISKDAGISIGALALSYALSKPYIDGVLIGVDSLNQLEQNMLWAQTQNLESHFEIIDNLMVEEVSLLNPVNWN